VATYNFQINNDPIQKVFLYAVGIKRNLHTDACRRQFYVWYYNYMHYAASKASVPCQGKTICIVTGSFWKWSDRNSSENKFVTLLDGSFSTSHACVKASYDRQGTNIFVDADAHLNPNTISKMRPVW